MSDTPVQTEGVDPPLDAMKKLFVQRMVEARDARANLAKIEEEKKKIEQREESIRAQMEKYVKEVSLDASPEDFASAFENIVQTPMCNLRKRREFVTRQFEKHQASISSSVSEIWSLAKRSSETPPPPPAKRPRTQILAALPKPLPKPRAKKPISRLELLRQNTMRPIQTRAEKDEATRKRAAEFLKEKGVAANAPPAPGLSAERREKILQKNRAAREKREAAEAKKKASELAEKARLDAGRAKMRKELEKQGPEFDIRAENDFGRRIGSDKDLESLFSDNEGEESENTTALKESLARIEAVKFR